MVLLAAPSNTWGIPGPVFLGLHLVAAAVLVAIALRRRNEVLNGSAYDANLLGPQQVAYLRGGTQLAVWTALAGLRSAGAINVGPDRRLTASDSLSIGSTSLDQTIHLAASRGLRAQELSRDRGVRHAVHQLRADLARHGLALSAEQRAALRDTALLPTGLFAVPIAALFDWPDDELDEAAFLTEILDRTGAHLLLDIANVYANARNRGADPLDLLDRLPLERVAYAHVAGGAEQDGYYHDTHTSPVSRPVLDLVGELCARHRPPALLLERDGNYPPAAALRAELDALAAVGGLPVIT